VGSRAVDEDGGRQERLEVRRVELDDGPPVRRQGGHLAADNFDFTNIQFVDNYVDSCTAGVWIDGSGASNDISGVVIERNHIIFTKGVSSGQGRAIHVAAGIGAGTDTASVRIRDNYILDSGLHSISVEKSIGVDIEGNHIDRHRQTTINNSQKPALRISESRNVTVRGNLFTKASDGCIEIIPSATNAARNIAVGENHFNEAQNNIPLITIGTTTPAGDGSGR